MPPGILPVFESLPGVRAFFTTREGGRSTGPYASLNLGYFTGDDPAAVRENWARVLADPGFAGKALALPRLCHGARLEEVEGKAEPGAPGTPASEPRDTDAVFTRSGEWVLAVTAGDCLPALIADPETRCVAAVHAGWRGSRDNVLGRALEMLFAEGRCRPATTRVALGPCLSAAALELPEDIARTLPTGAVRQEAGRFTFDLRACNRAQAEAAGVLPEHIEVVEGCTRSEPGRFFSYRRDGAASGRMAGCIALV